MLELDLSGAQALELANLDDWLREAGKKLGIKGEMRETCHQDKHGNHRVRVKVSCGGIHGAKFWGACREPLGNDARTIDLAGAAVVPIVAATKIWTMAGQWGLTLELRHAIVTLSSQECPELA